VRATVALDDDLLRRAQEYSGLNERTALLREALKALIEREAGRRLLALAGTMPNLKDIRRQRVEGL
jgi:Arc/MetJ family transcription regulator